MPEMQFRVRWPDKTVSSCYSPSLVIKDYLEVGKSYALSDFLRRSRDALNIASERVKQKYGFYCTSAMGQLAEINQTAERFSADADARVVVEAFEE
jgi:uncharacterized repeat protein (TIGR04042 family)